MTRTSTPVPSTSRFVRSQVDGAELELWTAGSGPDVVLVQGGGTNAASYRRLVARLSEHARVHVHDRRARGRSAPRPPDYGLHTEVGDLRTVLAETGATRVIGHSVGGLMALAAAREEPVERLALFDPAVSVDGSFPLDFLPELETAAAAGDLVDAVVIAGRGLRTPGSSLPLPLQRAVVRGLMRTGPGRTMVELVGTVPPETRMVAQQDGPADRWSAVTATTRFFIGARSPGYYLPAARALATALPDADVEVLPRLGHDAVARAPQGLVDSLATFLGLSRRPETDWAQTDAS